MAKAKFFVHAKKLEDFKKVVPDLDNNSTDYEDSIAFIEDSNSLWAKKHYYHFVPPGGKAGQYLTYDSAGKAKWTDMDLAMLHAYGVEWSDGVQDSKCTRIGNPLLHQQLPIQNAYRGCVAKGKEIQYYLDPKDWNHREFDWEVKVTSCTESSTCTECHDPSDKELADTASTSETATGEGAKYLCCTISEKDIPYIFRHAFVTISEHCHGRVCDVNTTAKQITVKLDTKESNFQLSTPSTTAIDESGSTNHTEIKSIFIGSNLSGCDGSVKVHTPKFYGRGWDIEEPTATKEVSAETKVTKHRVMISTDRIDATWTEIPEMLVDAYRVSWLSSKVYHRGYLSTLNKDTAISCMNDEDYMKGNNGSNSSTTDGDDELTKLAKSPNNKPMTNKERSKMRDAVKNADNHLMSLIEYQWIFYWPWVIEYATFNSLDTYLADLKDGLHQGGMGQGITDDTWAHWASFNSNNPICPNGYLNDIGNGTGQKDLKIKFPNNGTNSTPVSTADKTFKAFRWRGFDNAFGDIWTHLDGVVVAGTALTNNGGSSGTNNKEVEPPTIYLISNPDNFTDSLDGIEEKADRWYKMPDTNGYVKEWYVGENADMVCKELINLNNNTYKCDYYWINNNATADPRTLLGGGGLDGGSGAGLGASSFGWDVSTHGSNVGFRSVVWLGEWVQGLKDKWYYIKPSDEKKST